MINRLTYILLALMAVIPFEVSAVNSAFQTIEFIYLGPDTQRVNIKIPSVPSPANVTCAVMTEVQINSPVFDSTSGAETNNSTQLYTMALSALMAGRLVSFVIDDNACSEGGRPRVQSIYIR